MNLMRKLGILAALLFASVVSFAQITVSGHVYSTANQLCPVGSCQVVFRLRNYSGNIPRIVGTGQLAPTTITVAMSTPGVFSTSLYGNDAISPSNTFYQVDFLYQGKIVSSGNFLFTGLSPINLDTAVPIQPAPTPALDVAPFLSSNNTFTGINTFNGAVVFNSTVTFNNSATFSSINITGGSINGTVIGNLTPAAITGTTIAATVAFVGSLTGNASTATALASTPNLCSIGQGTRGIDASGNAQGCVTYVQLAGDLGNTAASPQVLFTHLSSPLPVNQGGTAVNDFSFNGSTHKVASVSGTLTNGHTVKVDASGNLVDGGAVTAGSSGQVTVGGIIFQWFTGSSDSAAEQTVTKTFPSAFPTNVWHVQVAYQQGVAGSTSDDCWYQVQSFSTTSVTLTKQGTGGTCQTSSPLILAIGN